MHLQPQILICVSFLFCFYPLYNSHWKIYSSTMPINNVKTSKVATHMWQTFVHFTKMERWSNFLHHGVTMIRESIFPLHENEISLKFIYSGTMIVELTFQRKTIRVNHLQTPMLHIQTLYSICISYLCYNFSSWLHLLLSFKSSRKRQ